MRIIPIKRLQLAKALWMDSFISIFHFQSGIKLVLEKNLFALIW